MSQETLLSRVRGAISNTWDQISSHPAVDALLDALEWIAWLFLAVIAYFFVVLGVLSIVAFAAIAGFSKRFLGREIKEPTKVKLWPGSK